MQTVNLNKLKAAMKAKKVTNAIIANETGVTPQWVSKVIRGHADSARIKATIAEKLELTVKEIWPEAA